MQNVHAMRPEVRAAYARAAAPAEGDDASATRFARFFSELRDPLVALGGSHPRFPVGWRALLAAIAGAAARRDPELRQLDHEREITPDRLQREQAIGSVAYVDRFAGTLRGVREALEMAIRRILLVHAVAFPHGGVPLVFMGDELGLRNDHGWLEEPARREDNRWRHRPAMLADFTAEPQPLHVAVAHERGLRPTPEAAVPDGRPLREQGEFLILDRFQYAWLQG